MIDLRTDVTVIKIIMIDDNAQGIPNRFVIPMIIY